jgi:hypothetical protein
MQPNQTERKKESWKHRRILYDRGTLSKGTKGQKAEDPRNKGMAD